MDKRRGKKEYNDWLLRERAKGGEAVFFFKEKVGSRELGKPRKKGIGVLLGATRATIC